ncbi:MAG: hypothetical protein HOP15_12245, partial [Planctomycetes bacterium]|nr:hypothetical protein [Planctomycetota bacterium]
GERVRAGLACELGLADAQAVKRWRAHARGGNFDPDACARELLPVALGAEDERRLLERAAALQRDLLLGAAGARTVATRRKSASSPGLFAFLLIQVLSFLVFAALVAAILYVLRIRGTSIDEYLDRFLLERFRRG